ncbi:YbbR-like domain-containing protein [Cesiribacter andamanensis]|uniref:YbbR-like protein n=1 Tax=Cesiribacter andamanensis AMV16 TaxID=1279009 RepID=M7N4L7_9BACT|nr:hypothetical protein [Cesiribacter andamanensis]EMR02232.1 hypothetical protein ADICEAN_02627 [Cesiribacter andamanensis AMV16]
MKKSELLFRGLKKLFSAERSKWKVVTLCILGATTFWFFNALNKQYATRLNYPVEFLFDEQDVIVVEELPKRVSIVVSGGGWNLLRKTLWFRANPIQILLENPTSQKYISKASLSAIIADQLNEVRLNYVVTDTLFINIERRISKKVRVHIDSTSISLADNHRVVSPLLLAPDSVVFTGPTSFINGLADSISVFIPQQQISTPYNEAVALTEHESRIVEVVPDQVQISFDVQEFVRLGRQVPIRPQNFPLTGSLQLQDSVVRISFWISRANAEQLAPGSFAIVADYNAFNQADSTIALRVASAPAPVERIRLEPETVKVRYVPTARRIRR